MTNHIVGTREIWVGLKVKMDNYGAVVDYSLITPDDDDDDGKWKQNNHHNVIGLTSK